MSLGGGWYYNSVSGAIISQPPVLGLPQGLLPGWYGPYPSKQAAVAFGQKMAQEGKGAAPAGFGQNVTNTVGDAAKNAGNALTNGILPENWFMRAGEIFIGLILLAIGLNTILKGTPVGDAAKTVAGAVPKVA